MDKGNTARNDKTAGRIFVHWLRISHRAFDDHKQYMEIDNYLNRYPDARATIFLYEFSPFERAIRFECRQCWSELDLQANSGFHGLRRLSSKPRHLCSGKPFSMPAYVVSRINAEQK